MSWLLLGASRGLGKAFTAQLQTHKSETPIFVASRKSQWKMDFATKEKWPSYLEQILENNPQRIVYFAGGGPFGKFSDKNWSDHEWALRVNFEFPAFLLHTLSREKSKALKQICVIGSAVAEASADANASSYSAGKHALAGLVKSLHAEKSMPFDLRLFSPGYMDTDLLPTNAWPRQTPGLVKDTRSVAEILFSWLLDDSKANSHLVIASKS